MQEEILKDINNHYLLLLTKSDLEKKIKEDNEKIYRKMQTNVKYKSNDFSLNIKLQEIEKKIEMISQRIINSFKYMTKIESSSLQSVLETEIASYDRQTLANSQKIELLKMEIEKNKVIIFNKCGRTSVYDIVSCRYIQTVYIRICPVCNVLLQTDAAVKTRQMIKCPLMC